VAVKIKLKRLGKIREPYYRIVVADARTKRDGRAIEEIGKYHPKAEPSFIEVNSERVQHWLSVGAQPTDPVRVLLKITGDWQKFTGEPGAEGTLRTAGPRADKKEAFEAAAKESQANKQAKEDKASSQGKAGTQSRTARPARDTQAKDTKAKESPAKESPAKAPAAKVTAEATDAAPADAAPTDAVVAEAAPAEAVVADAAPAEAVVADVAPEGATEEVADVKAAADESGSGA
jgi:small subunit ribosomal protein S16